MDNRYLSWMEIRNVQDLFGTDDRFIRNVYANEFEAAKKVAQNKMSQARTPTIAKSDINGCYREAVSLELYDIVDVLLSVPEWIDAFYLDEMVQDERTLVLLAKRHIIDQEEFLPYMQEMMLNYLKSWENANYDLEWVIERFHSLDRYFIVSEECKQKMTRLLSAYYPYFRGEKTRTPPDQRPEDEYGDGCAWCGMYRACDCHQLPQNDLLEEIEEFIYSLKIAPS